MKNTLKIQGFKCWHSALIELNNISVLIGSNGAGKSSIIQSLLLLSQVSGINDSNNTLTIPVHNIKGVDFGKLDDLIYDDGQIDSNSNTSNDIKLAIDDYAAIIPIANNDTEGHNIKVLIENLPFMSFPLGNVHYLDAERLGPRYVCEYKGEDIDSCGIHGENTAYMWAGHERDKVKPCKRLNVNTEGNFAIHLADWIDFIFDGVKLQLKTLYDRALQVQVANKTNSSTMLHIGFGVSYALPILVEGLLLKEGDTLIIENPEAHLHPKAQLRMGYFLAIMASSGIRLIVETHSEHVVRGINKAVVTDSIEIRDEDVSIYYIRQDADEKINQLRIEDVNKNKYPNGFFDEDEISIEENIKEREKWYIKL